MRPSLQARAFRRRAPACTPAHMHRCCFNRVLAIPPGDKNKKISAALAAVVQKHLGVPPSRFYIKFYDVARSDFGWNGATVSGRAPWLRSTGLRAT